MTRGLPGSGKSTWAREYIKDDVLNIVIINNDSLRKMFNDSYWWYDDRIRRNTESFVIQARDELICLALRNGKSIVLDETNLHPKSEEHVRELLAQHELTADIEIMDFTSVPLETCLQNDMKREKSVGESVIKRMYNQYLAPKETLPSAVLQVVPEWDPNIPDCIICDIDGTLANIYCRNPYDESLLMEDGLYQHIRRFLVNEHNLNDYKIILVSARSFDGRKMTEDWLEHYDVPYHQLFLRQKNDKRKDSIIKQEIYEREIKDKYNVMYVLDDRDQTVKMWRSLGLICLQVAPGAF